MIRGKTDVEEVVCALGSSYLLVRKNSGKSRISPLIRRGKVAFFCESDSDEVAKACKSGPFVSAESPQPYKFLRLGTEIVIAQQMEVERSKEEWSRSLAIIFQACEAQRIRHIEFLRPSQSLEAPFLSHGLGYIVESLPNWPYCAHVVLLAYEKSYHCKATLALSACGLCQPSVSDVAFREENFLATVVKLLRCRGCQRIASKPRMANGEVYCGLCAPPGAASLLGRLEAQLLVCVERVPVMCRCGVVVLCRDLDDHVLDCATKQWFCSEHQVGGSPDMYMTHLLDSHFEEVIAVLEKSRKLD